MEQKTPEKEKLYSLRELALRFGLGARSFFYYRNALKEFIPTVGEGRMRRYPEEAIPIFEEIVELKKAGVSLAELKVYFEACKQKFNPKLPIATKEGKQPLKKKIRTYVLE